MALRISSVWFLFKSEDIGGSLPDLGAGGIGLVDPPFAFAFVCWVVFRGRACKITWVKDHDISWDFCVVC